MSYIAYMMKWEYFGVVLKIIKIHFTCLFLQMRPMWVDPQKVS